MTNVYVAGHNGLVGSAICRRLRENGIDVLTTDRGELDLTDQSAVNEWFSDNPVDRVYMAAAKVGGINANDKYPAEFIRDNLVIQTNMIHAAWKSGVTKLLFLGSSCIYPKLAAQPLTEDCLLSGPLEPSNEWYAIAKIAGIKMCQAYRRQYGFDAISVMPTNLYGPGDNFDLQMSHVLPALLRKAHEAKINDDEEMVVWGSGTPKREFLYVDDLADACVFLMENYSDEQPINVGTGVDVSIADLARIITALVEFTGQLRFDLSYPDGTPRKLLDVSRLAALGWHAKTSLTDGLSITYEHFLSSQE